MSKILKDLPWEKSAEMATKVLTSPRVTQFEAVVSSVLAFLGVPETHHPDAEQMLLYLVATVLTLISYWYWLGYSHQRRRYELERKLKQAQAVVRDLEEKLLSLEALDLEESLNASKEGSSSSSSSSSKKEIRVWMDGAFDMMHYGHMNAFRLGRALGTKLIVGVNSDETIRQCKGPPVMNDEERTRCVAGCKFVDEVVTGVPYIMNEEYIKKIIHEYKVDYIVHGDDPCIVDGKDVYEAAQKMGKYLTIPRTEGISTTDIVGRMLLMTTSHHHNDSTGGPASSATSAGGPPSSSQELVNTGCDENRSHFLTTSRIIRLFGAGAKAPPSGARVVYMCGSWDMFHAGHVDALKAARSLGDYVLVGVYRDSVVNKMCGHNLPILTMHERVLSVLGCKYVDDVLMDAPRVVSQDMINSLRIALVVTAKPRGDSSASHSASIKGDQEQGSDVFSLPRRLGILHELDRCPETDLSVLDIVDRILVQHDRFVAKFAKKKAAEDEYYQNKYSHSGTSSTGGDTDAPALTVTATDAPTSTGSGSAAGAVAVGSEIESSPASAPPSGASSSGPSGSTRRKSARVK